MTLDEHKRLVATGIDTAAYEAMVEEQNRSPGFAFKPTLPGGKMSIQEESDRRNDLLQFINSCQDSFNIESSGVADLPRLSVDPEVHLTAPTVGPQRTVDVPLNLSTKDAIIERVILERRVVPGSNGATKTSFTAYPMPACSPNISPLAGNELKHQPHDDLSIRRPANLMMSNRPPPISTQLMSCFYCSFQTGDAKMLLFHQQMHVMSMQQQPMLCMICGQAFLSTFHFFTHIELDHMVSGMYKCNKCSFLSPEMPVLLSHLRMHLLYPERVFGNSNCPSNGNAGPKQYASVGDMPETRKYNCTQCSYSCEARQTLEKHIFYHQLNKLKVSREQYELEDNSAKPSNVFSCDQCDFTSSAMSGIVSHQKNHQYTSHECKICHIVVCSRDALEDHMRSHKMDGEFICDICGTVLRTLQKIVQHRRTHTGEKPFQCPHCSYRCSRKDNLKLHARRHALRKFHCPHCKFVTDNEPHLHKHMLRKHVDGRSLIVANSEQKLDKMLIGNTEIGLKPYICNTCGYIGMSAYKLNEHLRIHTGEKPFKCVFCDFKCARKGNLALHMRRHSPNGLVPGRSMMPQDVFPNLQDCDNFPLNLTIAQNCIIADPSSTDDIVDGFDILPPPSKIRRVGSVPLEQTYKSNESQVDLNRRCHSWPSAMTPSVEETISISDFSIHDANANSLNPRKNPNVNHLTKAYTPRKKQLLEKYQLEMQEAHLSDDIS